MAFEKLRSLLKELPLGRLPGWQLFVDGKEVGARVVELLSEYALFRWGFNGVYDTLGIEEPGGGGAVLVPYFVDADGMLWIGVVKQPRPYQSEEPVLNLPRGFMNPGETHFETAIREDSEEIGSGEESRITLLDGEGGNPNSTFFITVGTNADGSLKGVRFYGVRFSKNEVETLNGVVYRFREGVVSAVTLDAEKIMGTAFLPWTDVAQLGCLMSNAGVARLTSMQALKKIAQ